MQKLESSVERDLLWRKREISHIYIYKFKQQKVIYK